MAATDRLIVTYTGNDERTNLAAAARGAGRRAARRRRPRTRRGVVRRAHPLQPFDPRNFAPGALVPGAAVELRPRRRCAGAAGAGRPRAAPRGRSSPRRCRRSRRRSSSSTTSSRFVEHPVRAFLRQRLGISVARLLRRGRRRAAGRARRARASGASASGCSTRGSPAPSRRAAILAEIARGTLPPGAARPSRSSTRSAPVVDEIVAAARAPPATSARLGRRRASRCPTARTLSGTVPGVGGDVLRTVTYSRVEPAPPARRWVRLLALTRRPPGAARSRR